MNGRIRRERVCDLTPSEVTERIRVGLRDRHVCEGKVRNNHAVLCLLEHERHLWSPWVDIEVREVPEGARLECKVGPNPEVWTLFVFLWSGMVAVLLFGGMIGLGQAMVGEDPVGLYAAGAAVIGLVISCGINITGQRGTVDQQAVLERFLDEVLAPEA